MDMTALFETVSSCMLVPLFVLGVVAAVGAIVLVVDKKVLHH
jgi:hypothetical protein